MADSDKDILITPNVSQTSQPEIKLVGKDNSPMFLKVLDDNTLSFEGTEGQVFSIGPTMSSGDIFSVSDISGVQNMAVNADGSIKIIPTGVKPSSNLFVGDLRHCFVYARGTGNNNAANSLVYVNGSKIVDSATRGLNLTIINQVNLNVISSTNYDTFANQTNNDNLATAIGNMTDQQIGILVSEDAWETSNTTSSANLVAAAKLVGLTKLGNIGDTNSGNRRPYAAIFMGSGDDANAANKFVIERMSDNDADAPMASVSAILVSDGTHASIMGSNNVNAIWGADSNHEEPALIADEDNNINILGGNVGIGTTTPLELLSLKSTTAGAGISLHNATAAESLDTGDVLNSILFRKHSNGNRTLMIYNTSGDDSGGHDYHSSDLRVAGRVRGTGDTLVDRFTIVGHNGNVGIGTTSPSHRLQVTGGDLFVRNNDIHISQGAFKIKNASDGNQALSFPSDGNFAIENVNVGIGTTSPGTNLHISDDSTGLITGLRVENVGSAGNSATVAGIEIKNGAGTPSSTHIEQDAFGITRLYTGQGAKNQFLHASADGGTVTVSNVVVGNNGSVKAGGSGYLLLGNNNSGLVKIHGDTGNSIVEGFGNHLVLQTVRDGDDIRFRVNDGGTESDGTQVEAMIVEGNTGNVGIGTTTPSTELHLSGADHPSIRITGTDNSNADPAFELLGTADSFAEGGQLWYDNGTGKLHLSSLFSSDNADIQFHTRTAADRSTSNVRMTIKGSGNVGIGTTSPSHKLEVNGSFAATTKSFDIEHPTKEGKRLHHGSLEGPEHGVYIRGRLEGDVIELPDYWLGLVDEDTITVQLTPNKGFQQIYVDHIEDNKVFVGTQTDTPIDCFYFIQAERKDVEKMVVEY